MPRGVDDLDADHCGILPTLPQPMTNVDDNTMTSTSSRKLVWPTSLTGGLSEFQLQDLAPLSPAERLPSINLVAGQAMLTTLDSVSISQPQPRAVFRCDGSRDGMTLQASVPLSRRPISISIPPPAALRRSMNRPIAAASSPTSCKPTWTCCGPRLASKGGCCR